MSADAERADRRDHRGSRRGPGRFLAPLALIIVVIAVIVIIASSGGSSNSSSSPVVVTSTTRSTRSATGTSTQDRTLTQSGSASTATTDTSTTATSTVGTYTIASGDTFSVIAEKTGVSVATIEKLNPDVSSSALTVGQVIKLK